MKIAIYKFGIWAMLILVGIMLGGCGSLSPDTQCTEDIVVSDLTRVGTEKIEIDSHKVSATDRKTSEKGKYDAIDQMEVTIECLDPLEVFPQKKVETVEYKRVKGTDTWEATGATCTRWEINRKKIGGTAWKRTEGDTTYYLRFSGAVEFISVDLVDTEGDPNVVLFATSMPGAIALETGDEVELYQFIILSGQITSDGEITLNFRTREGERKVKLNDFEKIDREELPFTQKEFEHLEALEGL